MRGALRIPVRGTLGLTLIAERRGHISSACRVLEQLVQGGMYFSDEVMRVEGQNPKPP